MSRVIRSGILVPIAMFLVGSAPLHADLIINASFDSSITSDANAAAIEGVINSAIAVYEATFTNPITVNISFSEMSSGLGQSSTFFTAGLPYSAFYSALGAQVAANPSDSTKATAFSHLPNSATDPVRGNSDINIKTADARALGFNVNPPAGQPDGSIGLNTHITDTGSPGTTGQYSLLATTEHEINEVLGLGSSLAGIPFGQIFPEDLYRYDASGNRSFTPASANAYFSLNGTTDLAQFNNQSNGGDYGDWQSLPLPNGVNPQVQDAFATPGSHPTLGSNEIAALDAIGYTVANSNPVPEPGSFTLICAGTLLVTGFAYRRRKPVQAGR